MNVVTVVDTLWHKEGEGSHIIPAGTEAFVLTKDHLETLEEELQWELKRVRSMYKKREIDGVFIYLQGKYRWMPKSKLLLKG